MGRSEVVCKGSQYYCYHLLGSDGLDELDLDDIMAFEPVDSNGLGLVRYLRKDACRDEADGAMRTYLVRDLTTDELAGYFSLKAGLVSLDESKEGGRVQFDTVPGIELANFAFNGKYRKAHPASKGGGALIFDELVQVIVQRAAEYVGAFLLYIYSLPYERLMENYASYGFVRLPEADETQLHARLKPRYDDHCVFMYMRV